jgi:DNA helicase II / ATP-dependent DNA helicase PcrA
MSTPLLFPLVNSQQRRAIEHQEGPMLVVAGAGSGKTRTLTLRIANLILRHGIDPSQIFAVTFTNKAAGEMKERIQQFFVERRALEMDQRKYEDLPPQRQYALRAMVSKAITQPLWVGTFHALCGRILRFDIERYKDWQGRSWQKNFNIADEGDVQSLIKEIVTKELNLDDKRYNPRGVRSTISGAKSQGLTPEQFKMQEGGTIRSQRIAEVYERYQTRLAQNNTLDFDDLIWVPVLLFQQNPDLLNYWHNRFNHILVDEYQDTNRAQYQLIRLLATNSLTANDTDWKNRSLFVVGDGDQSIYAFRGADVQIILDFQRDFGDGLPDDQTKTMIKLEENYRSCANILSVANTLIENNSGRLDKVLKPTRDHGAPVYSKKAEDEIKEADFIVGQIRHQEETEAKRSWKDFAVLYRTNVQSRVVEETLMRWGIPYTVIGGLKFYDRREVKDILCYLKAIHNSDDGMSIQRIINTPRRGIGNSTLTKLMEVANGAQMSLWQVLSSPESVKTIAGRTARPILEFVALLQQWQEASTKLTVAELLEQVIEESGYARALVEEGTDEALNRAENVHELLSVARQFEEQTDDPSLDAFLANIALASDLDQLGEQGDRVSLMTLHSAKGLEFPVVFLCGMEQGLLPHFRSLDDPKSLEEERRLCYVGVTRAQERLFLSHAQERRLYGDREPAITSQFLEEVSELLSGDSPRKSFSPGYRTSATKTAVKSASTQTWDVGEVVLHPSFGQGQITHVLGTGEKLYIAVNFPGLGKKILDPRTAALEKI